MTALGKFITFEGGDGSGKSTQVRLLDAALKSAGISCITTREPGGTPQAERIRNLLLQRDSGTFEPMTEALLFFAARREHLTQKIWPEMKKGHWVISDRFADSTRAFQGAAMGLDFETIDKLYDLIAGKFKPDLTFIFDIDPAVGLERSMKHNATSSAVIEKTEDRYERMGVAFQARLRQGFLTIAKSDAQRCVVIDAAQTVDQIHADILRHIEHRLGTVTAKAAHG